LQQRLGDREDAFAAEDVALSKPEVFDLAGERSFSQCVLQKYAISYFYM